MDNIEGLTYEQALGRLEEITKSLETGADLERSLALFEEANKLAVFCKNKLDSAEQKITALTSDGEEVPYDG